MVLELFTVCSQIRHDQFKIAIYNGGNENERTVLTVILKRDGSLLLYDERKEILETLTLTSHAKRRFSERGNNFNLQKVVMHSPVCYWSREGYVICAVDEYRALVLGCDSEGRWRVVTLTEKSKNNYRIIDKWLATRINANNANSANKGVTA